jgi:hypothetical protein
MGANMRIIDMLKNMKKQFSNDLMKFKTIMNKDIGVMPASFYDYVAKAKNHVQIYFGFEENFVP